jgi:ATP-dependent DNA ligase
MMTTPVSVPDLRPGFAAESKSEGFRALVSVDAGQVVLRSRHGTEITASFPEVVAGAVQLPDPTALDGVM